MSNLLRSVRRIAFALAIMLGIVFFVTQWVSPVVLSVKAARKPPTRAWLIPRDLRDVSISPAPGTKLSYFGYEFEVPWTDLDETKTKTYPDGALLTFHSGLKLMIGASPSKLLLNGLYGKSKITEAEVEQTLGVHSDYGFLASLYSFTPDKMHLWALSPSVHYRETLMLSLKSVILHPESETGFFYLSNPTHKGFQEGDPQAWPSNYRPKCRSVVIVTLFPDEGSFSLVVFQKDFQNPAGVTQAEINRIIQSLHRVQGSVAGANTSLQ